LSCKASINTFKTDCKYVYVLIQYDPNTVTTRRNRDTGERWELLDDRFKTRVVECKADQGLYGADDSSTNPYAADGETTNGHWVDSADADGVVQYIQDHQNDTYTLYSGNYLNWTRSATTTRTRLEIVQEVATSLINAVNGVNVGLMHYNNNEGGLVVHALENVTTARAAINAKINALTPGGFTPLSETLYEAALYYKGGKVVYGTGSVAESRDGDNYVSPITNTCQQNHIVFLSDGLPTQDVSATTAIQDMVDYKGKTFNDLTGRTTCDVENALDSNGVCFDDLAEVLFEGDNSLLPGTDPQTVKTYTIGFAEHIPVLQEAAERGGGEYYQANDTAELSTALTNILAGILDTSQTFSSPTVAVNAFNRTQNLSDLFITVFRPTGRPHWQGNLKKYSLRPIDAEIMDAQTPPLPAVGPDGFFKETAVSYWSDTVDGRIVTAGGAANELPVPAERKIYTNLGASDALTDDTNQVADGNLLLTDEELDISGIIGEPTREQVIRYIRGEDFRDWNGIDGTTDNRNQLGDPLHSTPVSAIYGPGQRDGLLFFATNDGMLHALDLETGVEQWAFIPYEFLRDQILLYQNDSTADKHYGIDGDLRILMVGDNDNVVETGEKVFLYFGMGRGGDFYYALDVTRPLEPAVLWTATSGALPKLGQSWSTPVPTRIDIQGANYHAENTEKHVLVIGGGYEPDQDNETFSTDSLGNALYIVDAYSGELLWSASNSGATQNFAAMGRSMDYSIPARIRVVDFDGNGLADRFYAGDMGGQIWRFDVKNGSPAASLVAGGVIAQLGAAPNDPATVPADTIRRFYYAPDVATVNTRTENFIHVGIGSGHRGHPLNMTNHDRFFALRDGPLPMDQAAFDALTPITAADLQQITSANTTITSGKRGWYLDLNIGAGWNGEKVLAEARTFNNQVIFSTFRPGTDGVPSCTPQLGTNRIYQVNIFNGAPVTNLDGVVDDAGLTMTDMFVQNAGGILSTAQALFVDADSNNNGIPDAEEDADGDGIPDEHDEDFVGPDQDEDGIPDSEDDDVDGDGIPNVDDDDDGDGIPNRLDQDDDGDGILDVDEEDDTPVICVGLICFPAGFQNTPVRTFWAQESVD
jgi:type IV pilus assembly protein PilY1